MAYLFHQPQLWSKGSFATKRSAEVIGGACDDFLQAFFTLTIMAGNIRAAANKIFFNTKIPNKIIPSNILTLNNFASTRIGIMKNLLCRRLILLSCWTGESAESGKNFYKIRVFFFVFVPFHPIRLFKIN